MLVALLTVASRLPAWSMAALPLVLAASELSPLIALLALIAAPVAWGSFRASPRLRLVTTVVAIACAIVASGPALSFRGIVADASAQLGAVGAGPLSTSAALRTPPQLSEIRERRIDYAAADGSPLAMRLFERGATPVAPRPLIVVMYGGAWRAGEPEQGARVSRALAASGWLVAAIDYRHAPRFVWPAQLDDVRRSVTLLRDSAIAWRVDTTRIALLGRSAGGHLAELEAFATEGPRVRGVVVIYAPWNLAEGYRDVPTPDPIGVRAVIGQFVGGAPEQRPAEYRAASPSSYVRAGLPPVLLLFGSNDHLVKPRFNREAASALRSAGTPLVSVELPWSEHGFDQVPAGLGERLAWGVERRFLEWALTRP